MKIQAQLIESSLFSYQKKDEPEKTIMTCTVMVPHDDPADGYQVISGGLDPDKVSGLRPLKSGEIKYPAACEADVILANRNINGYQSTTLRLSAIRVLGGK